MNKTYPGIIYLALFSFLILQNLPGKDLKNNDNSRKMHKTMSAGPIYTHFNINKISTWIKNDGESDISQSGGNSGFTFPKGGYSQCVYQSGFLWGGVVDTLIHVGGSAYTQGLVPGKILSNGQPEDPLAPNVHIYRVRPDYKTASFTAEIHDGEGTFEQIYAQYEKDWKEWPAQDGAPFKDVDGDNIYNPDIDIPGVPGADQTIWFVANDLNRDITQRMYGSDPMGIEMQATIWGYNQDGALGNMMFRKYKIINKSGKTFKNMYVSMFSDTDVGTATDDFVGCDTTLSLAFGYNAKAKDPTYGYIPPAVGFDFFQGPVVPGNSNDVAIAGGRRIPGKKNLGMTAFYFFINGDPIYIDPQQSQYTTGTLYFYNLFQGKVASTGQYFPIPSSLGGGETKFPLSGDPLTGKGWVDGIQHPAGDRRLGMASGPFTMADRDTQEIVVAEIAAGAIQGVDRLGALGLLKFYDLQAQTVYDNSFNVSNPPPTPKVTVTTLDKEIVMDWGDDPEFVKQLENSNNNGFLFQGYNVYQFPNSSASLSEGKRIATFDLNDGLGKIEGLKFDPASGVVMKSVLQFGSDIGIKRNISIREDAFKSMLPLNNGSRYYFAVTAYSYNPDPNTVPNTLETPPVILTIVPESLTPGERLPGKYGDSISVKHEAGRTDAKVVPVIIDPKKMNGDSYKVTFDSSGGSLKWNLTNLTKNRTVLSDQTNFADNESFLSAEGLLLKVIAPAGKFISKVKAVSGELKWTGAGGASDLDGEGLNGTLGNGEKYWGKFGESTVPKEKSKTVLIKFASTDDQGNILDPSDPEVSFAYRYMRKAAEKPARDVFAPFIINPASGYAYQDYKRNFPFAAYDMEGIQPRRLMVGYLENNVEGGMVDGKYFPPDGENAANMSNMDPGGPREWFYIFDMDYKETPDPELTVDILNNPAPVLWFGVPARTADAKFSSEDEIEIFATHVITPEDIFTFTAPKVVEDNELAKEDIKSINVFPNPYYGVNAQELNKYQRFVTFNHLPKEARIRIYNLAGKLVRTIEHTSGSQFEKWNLCNDDSLPVGSGLYIAHIDMPGLGTKILKIAVVQEQQVLDRF